MVECRQHNVSRSLVRLARVINGCKRAITGSKTHTKAFSCDFPLTIPVMTSFAVNSGVPRARERRHIPEKILVIYPSEKFW